MRLKGGWPRNWDYEESASGMLERTFENCRIRMMSHGYRVVSQL